MKKLMITTVTALALANAAVAGDVSYATHSEPVEAPAMGEVGGWLVPLLAVTLIMLAAGSSSQKPFPCGRADERC
ncbi:MAG TPA: hypothetical protein VLA51_00665 [Paracoccaceae bacterium]|nr:hypothetical protein [Paracoccaceae bacterium]